MIKRQDYDEYVRLSKEMCGWMCRVFECPWCPFTDYDEEGGEICKLEQIKLTLEQGGLK